MDITKREITKEEHNMITEDFKKIEKQYGVPDANTKRLNVTATEDGEVIGFGSGLTNRKWFTLTDLWVHERYRGKGFGAKLLRMLEEDVKAEGIKHMYTWTTGFNSNEIFYKKQGYRQVFMFEDMFEVKNGHHICLRKDI